jgi:hypothetical protein
MNHVCEPGGKPRFLSAMSSTAAIRSSSPGEVNVVARTQACPLVDYLTVNARRCTRATMCM